MRYLRFLAPAFLAVLSCVPASAEIAVSPKGWLSFCVAHPSFCAKSEPASVPVAGRETIIELNRRVNASILPQTDRAKVSPDYWQVAAPQGLGDCKSYALTKWMLLTWSGVPAGAMRLATVHVPGAPASEDHVVLIVKIGTVSYVLDNLTDIVWPAGSVAYEWLSVQEDGNPWQWVELAAAPQ